MEPKLLCDQGDSEQSIFSSYVEERGAFSSPRNLQEENFKFVLDQVRNDGLKYYLSQWTLKSLFRA